MSNKILFCSVQNKIPNILIKCARMFRLEHICAIPAMKCINNYKYMYRSVGLGGRYHTGQCKRTGGCYNELVVAFFSTGGGVKGKKIYTC